MQNTLFDITQSDEIKNNLAVLGLQLVVEVEKVEEVEEVS